MSNGGMVKTSITSILDTFTTKIIFLQPVYECIANAFEAGASKITVEFICTPNLLNENEIYSIVITDNGEGFTEENVSSFSEYMSKRKAKLGCKGVGRFTWLKVFKDITIDSVANNQKVQINFSRNFDIRDDIKIFKQQGNDFTGTKITFNNIVENYKNEEINLKLFKDKILDYFYVNLLEFKNIKKTFEIKLCLNDEALLITTSDLSDLESKSILIKSELDGIEYDFNIKYTFLNNNGENECYFCGNGRLVEKIKLERLFLKLPKSEKIKILVSSKYFDDRINYERTLLDLKKTDNNPTILNPLTFNEIILRLENELETILFNRFPEISKNNESIINSCINQKPYLSKYIREDKSIIKDEKKLINDAEKAFEKDKKETTNNFLRILNEKEIDSEKLSIEFEKLNDLSARELAQYFLFRQTIIDTLKSFIDRGESFERYLHNLFLNLGKRNDSEQGIRDKYSNCIRLLDDKFMSFNRMYSDTKIKSILKDLKQSNTSFYGEKEPDLTIFYSSNDVVVVEFKAIGAKSIEKANAFSEINRNMGIIAKNFEELNNLYGYIITQLDDETIQNFSVMPGVTKMFSDNGRTIFYCYNQNIIGKDGRTIPTHIYVLSTENIYYDANARNKHFIEIIKNK